MLSSVLKIAYSYLPLTFILLFNFAVAGWLIFIGETRGLAWSSVGNLVMVGIFILFFVLLLVIAIKVQQQSPVHRDLDYFISLIIPVYNEDQHIYNVLKNIEKSDFPRSQMEIIIINDGSTDNSLNEIQRFQKQYNGEVYIMNFKSNKGKKAGLVSGFKKAKGEVLITIDSDTFLEVNSVTNLLMFFDKNTAAVSGYTNVYNASDNVLTRIQGYEYFISHHLFKAFESHYSSVLCCPGCFSGYRREPINNVLEKFIESKVFRFPIDYGEDRYLTSLLIKNNYQVKYASTARASTIVPNRLMPFITQRIRWVKSWFINSIYLIRTSFKKPIFFTSYFLLSFIFNILIVSIPVLLAYLLFTGQMVIFVHSAYIILLYIIFHFWKTKILNILDPVRFFVFTIMIYSWLIVWAVSKVNDKSWGKRANN
tara:strand:- start:786 stop:2057 length:1272 start_codon:yes stop_codon:yes gene_type:complete